MLRVPQGAVCGEGLVQVTAQSTPLLPGSLLTTGLNVIPVVLPTGTVDEAGGGFNAIETAGCVFGAEEPEPLLHPTRREVANTKPPASIHRLAATASLPSKIKRHCPARP